MSTTASETVDGQQTNDRAEPSAILAALRLHSKSNSRSNLLIVTDSETTITIIEGLKTKELKHVIVNNHPHRKRTLLDASVKSTPYESGKYK